MVFEILRALVHHGISVRTQTGSEEGFRLDSDLPDELLRMGDVTFQKVALTSEYFGRNCFRLWLMPPTHLRTPLLSPRT